MLNGLQFVLLLHTGTLDYLLVQICVSMNFFPCPVSIFVNSGNIGIFCTSLLLTDGKKAFVTGGVVGGQEQVSRLCVRDEGSCLSSFPAPDSRPPATKALHTICGTNTIIVSSSWWWVYKCPKHVEQIISTINHSVASSWFYSLRLYNDARTNRHQINRSFVSF